MAEGWEVHAPWRETMAVAEGRTGAPLRRFMAEGPLEALRAQRCAPYAVLAHSVGIYRTRRALGMPLPVAATGHSMGFYSALVAAEVVPLEAALDLITAVEDRCEDTFAPSSMGMAFFIGVPELELRQAMSGLPEAVLSNRNGKAQFTVSGPAAALNQLVAALQPKAMKAGLLPVQHPLHGPHMAPLLPAIARRLSVVAPAPPAFPLVSHFDGRLITGAAAAWDEGLASVALPVDWLQVVRRLEILGAPLAECGYGRQLSSLTRWADRSLEVASFQAAP